MAQSLPWSVKGIDANTREAAREAARRAGMSVSEWLESLIREEARKTYTDAARPVGTSDHDAIETDIAARLRRLSQSGSGAALDRAIEQQAADRGSDRSLGTNRNLDVLLSHAAQLELRTRDAETKTTSALESIVGWIEKAESRMAAAERAAADRQDRATSVIADAIKTVSSRVADVERRGQPALQPEPERQPARGDHGATVTASEHRGAHIGVSPRRPSLSRDSLASAVTDIQVRQRQLSEPQHRPQPSTLMQNLREDIGRIAGVPLASDHGTTSEHADNMRDRLAFPDRRSGDRRPDVTPLMNSLRDDLAQLRQDIASLASAPPSSKLEDSIRDLARQLEQRAVPTPLDELSAPLARIEAEIGRLQAHEPGHQFNRVETELQRLGQRIEALATSAHEPRLLAAAVHELTGLKDALARTNQAPKIDDLSTQIAALAQDMARVREDISRANPINDLEIAIEDMRASLLRETRDANGIGHGLLQRIMHQMENVSAAITNVPTAGMGDADRQQLALLSNKLDQLAHRTQPESDLLARQIEALAIKLDDMSDRDSGDLLAGELLNRVERLSKQIDVMASQGPAAIEKQIDTLAARIEGLAAAQQKAAAGKTSADVNLRPIETMIGDLAKRLEDVTRPGADNQSLVSLERQIAALADRLDTRPVVSDKADKLENTLQDLMRDLGGLREETTTAVDRAARAAVADALTGTPSTSSNHAGDITLLRNDLAGLKDVHVSIDKRTHSAIGAVNDTLEKIVQRLAQLEGDVTRDKTQAARFSQHHDHANTTTEPSRQQAHVERSDDRDARASASVFGSASRFEHMAAAVSSTAPANGQSQRSRHSPLSLEPRSDDMPDLPLEPGSGRPRSRSDASLPSAGSPAPSVASAGLNPNLIAAARRAAMAASAEAESLKSDDKKAGRGKSGKMSLPISLKETLEKRRKPILLGLAAIVLAMGASQVANTLLTAPSLPQAQAPAISPDAPRASVEQGRSSRTDQSGASRTDQGGASRGEPTVPDGQRSETAVPAPALPKDQTSSLAQDSQKISGIAAIPPLSETTGSVRTPPVDMASLSPAQTPPDATGFAAGLGRVTNLGDLAPTIGTPALRRAAQDGDPNAVYELAVRATDGVGMARDPKLALRLFERAAAAGFGPAQFRLGNMHEKGIGITRDPKLAMTWYRRAADKGNAKAMHNLAVLIAEGADGRPDYAAAAEMFRKAAEFGVRDSQYNLAILLGRGLGAEQDLTQSYIWFSVAARQGDTDAAKKRDEVGAKLTPVDLSAGRNAALAWKAKTADPVANEASAPADGWDAQPRQQRVAPKARAT